MNAPLRHSGPLVRLSGVDLTPGGHAALRGVDMTIAPAEIVTVIGPNGAGKTTLMRAILGGLSPTAGTLTRAPGLRIGYVPQSLALDPALPMTGRRFLSLPRPHPGADDALTRAGVADCADRPMATLSGGQLRRTLLARAMLDAPDLLILDEPTTGLDQQGAADLFRDVARLRDETACAVLLVSHDLHVVMAASDRVLCLNGHVCCEGTPHAVAETPAYRALFGDGALALYRHRHDHVHD
ncbi:MAG: ATP-binding cassette domain-containing protein [Paracoccaceae bacterium]